MMPQIRPEGRNLTVAVIASIFMNFFAIAVTRQFSTVIDKYIPESDLPGLMCTATGIFLCAVLYFICHVVFLKKSKEIALGVQHRLRKLVFSHVMNCRYVYFVKKSQGQVNTNVVQDVETFCASVFERLLVSASNILFFVITFVLLFWVNIRITTVLVLYIVVVTIYMYSLKRIMARHASTYSAARSNMNEAILDLTAHQKSILLYGRQEMHTKRIYDRNKRMVHAWLKRNIFSPLIQSSVEVSILISYLLAFGIGWFELQAGKVSYGDLFLYLTYIPQLWNRYSSAIDVVTELAQAEVYAKRILDAVYREEREDELPRHPERNTTTEGGYPTGIQIRDLCFSFAPEYPIWNKFSMDFVKPGIYGISGPSGCGKSTLFDLLVGLYQPQSGQIIICEKDIAAYDLDELRKTVGIVPQDSYYVRGSILDNLTLFNTNITEEQLVHCLTECKIEKELSSIPFPINEPLQRNDPRLTSGQKRLICLVRTLLRQPKILLFDEVTAGLDSNTEIRILEIIKRLSEKHVCLFISHKQEDLQSADYLIELSKKETQYSDLHYI